MAKLKLFLLDANIVLELHVLGIWHAVLSKCQVTLTASVVQESQFFENAHGEKTFTNLEAEHQQQLFDVVAIPVSQVQAFRDKFKPDYLSRLDLGETESLVHLLATTEEYRLCSADAIVFKVLACLGMEEQGISLEVLLNSIGLGRFLPVKLCEDFRKQKTLEGRKDALMGRGLI